MTECAHYKASSTMHLKSSSRIKEVQTAFLFETFLVGKEAY